ncbi:MAG: phosphatase PAP2 family protein [bacterium]
MEQTAVRGGDRGREDRTPAADGSTRIRWEFQDIAMLSYLGVVVVLLLVLGAGLGRHTHPWRLIIYHLALAAAGLGARSLPRWWDHPAARFLRWWYPVILMFFCFTAVGWMIHIIRPAFVDPFLLDLERALFGVLWTPLLQQFAHPVLTEVMYFFYTAYYFLIPGLGLPLYLEWREEGAAEQGPRFREYMLAVTLTFWVCYLHFLVTPGAGPVFWSGYPGPVLTLDGGPITAFEQWLFARGAIVGGAFPSSHVAVAFVIAIYSVRFRVASWFFAPVAVGLAISTMYNGYHYGVDVVWGIAVAVVMAALAPPLFTWWEHRLDEGGRGTPEGT